MPNILLWSILCKTVGLPSSTGESERTARRQLHSPTLRCFRGRLCEVAAGRGPLKQSRWAESNWTLPLRSVGVAPSLGRFWLVFAALKLRYVLRRHIILSDSDGNRAVLDCFTVSPGLGGSAKWFYVTCCDRCGKITDPQVPPPKDRLLVSPKDIVFKSLNYVFAWPE